jgi:hypothetical protein
LEVEDSLKLYNGFDGCWRGGWTYKQKQEKVYTQVVPLLLIAHRSLQDVNHPTVDYLKECCAFPFDTILSI